MTIKIKHLSQGIVCLSIEDQLTIYTVAEQKQQLLAYLKSAVELQLDLSEVAEIDSAGVQLLMYLKQLAIHRSSKFSLMQHSQAVVQTLEMLNLSKHFGDPIVISAEWAAL